MKGPLSFPILAILIAAATTVRLFERFEESSREFQLTKDAIIIILFLIYFEGSLSNGTTNNMSGHWPQNEWRESVDNGGLSQRSRSRGVSGYHSRENALFLYLRYEETTNCQPSYNLSLVQNGLINEIYTFSRWMNLEFCEKKILSD